MPYPPPRLEEIFGIAIEIPSAAARLAYLDEACRDHPALRSEVESLLASHAHAGDFLEPPGTQAPTWTSDPDAAKASAPLPQDGPGVLIGPYQLLQRIGEGGMGTVYMAEQTVPVRRLVALKILKLGMDTQRIIARFEAERQALAMMAHPNIAQVLDAGTSESGRPYFVMELVRGIPITTYCDQHRLPLEARLRLFCDVCRAVQHAHQKGIIHRDLKPTNILVTLHEEGPTPKVIDFGIAKSLHQPLTDKTLFTEAKQLMGTPQYMSPEQASMSALDVDTRADIYSLGVVLYELLTSQTPFDADALRATAYQDLQRLIQEIDPPAPSNRLSTLGDMAQEVAQQRQTEMKDLGKAVRGDLDWIVMKALEKDRARRFDTAIELARDVERHMRCEPILAGSPAFPDRLRKFARRHRVGVLAGSTVSIVLLLAMVIAMWGWLHARQQTQLARQATHEARTQATRSQSISDFLQDILASVDPQQAVRMNVDIEHSLTTARAVFGEDHATVAATMTSLAARLERDGDLNAASSVLTEALSIWARVQGTTSPHYLRTLTRLGRVQADKGEDRAAERIWREVIRLGAGLAEPSLPAVADAHDGLAHLVAARGDDEEAASLLCTALQMQPTTGGQRFVHLERLDRLRQVLTDAGRNREVETIWREQLDLAGELYPSGSLRLADLTVAFAHFLSEHGKEDEAEQRVREAISIYETRPTPPIAPLIQAQRLLYGLWVNRPNGYQKAEHLRRQIDGHARALWGDNDLRLADMRFEFAQIAYRRGQPGVAIEQTIDALQIYRREAAAYFDAKPLVRLIRWSVLMANRGRYPLSVYEAAVRGAQIVVASEPEEARAHTILGIAQFRAGRYAEARQTLLEADRRYSGPSGGAPPTLAFLAMSHYALGEIPQARQLLGRAQTLMQDPRWAGDADDQRVVDEAALFLSTSERVPDPDQADTDQTYTCLTGT